MRRPETVGAFEKLMNNTTQRLPDMHSREDLLALFVEAVRAVSPEVAMPAFLPIAATGRTVVIAVGKAAAEMMRVAQQRNRGHPLEGLVVTRTGHLPPGAAWPGVEVIEAGSTVLPPILARFLADHPEIEIDLFLDDHRAELLSGRHDLALRVGDLKDASLVTRALVPMRLLCCASPSYLARAGYPTDPTDLASHTCLDFLLSTKAGAWRFDTPEGGMHVPVSGRLRSDGALALRGMALCGAGIVLLPTILVKDDIDAGLLVPLLEGWTPGSRPVQLLTLPGRPPVKLRLLIDALVSGLAA